MEQIPLQDPTPEEHRMLQKRNLCAQENRLNKISELDQEELIDRIGHWHRLSKTEIPPETRFKVDRILAHLAFEKIYRQGELDCLIAKAIAKDIPDTAPKNWT